MAVRQDTSGGWSTVVSALLGDGGTGGCQRLLERTGTRAIVRNPNSATCRRRDYIMMRRDDIGRARSLLDEIDQQASSWVADGPEFQRWHMQVLALLQDAYGAGSTWEKRFLGCIRYGEENPNYPAKWDNWYQRQLNESFQKMLARARGSAEAIAEALQSPRPLAPKSTDPAAKHIEPDTTTCKWDVFICHASEDKDAFVRPLAHDLAEAGVRVWFDELSLQWGDSLRRSIDRGLARCQFGLVVLSRHFFEKDWPQKELDALAAREVGGQKVVLPIWHGVSREDVVRCSPMLADRLAIQSSLGTAAIVAKVQELLRSNA